METANNERWSEACSRFEKFLAYTARQQRFKTKFTEIKKATLYPPFIREAITRGESIYPIMRLMLPILDRERRKYQMKDHRVAEAYVHRLGMGDHPQAMELKHWKVRHSKVNSPERVAWRSGRCLAQPCGDERPAMCDREVAHGDVADHSL